MNNKKTAILLFFLILINLVSINLYADNGIVVWKLSANSDINDKSLKSLNSYITSEVELNSGKKVISEDDIVTIMQGQEKIQRCGINDTVCLAEIAGALGVQFAVSGDLGRIGEIWLINIKLIDVENIVVIKRVSRKVEGTDSDVVRVISKMIKEMFSNKTKKIISSNNNLNQTEKTINLTPNNESYLEPDTQKSNISSILEPTDENLNKSNSSSIKTKTSSKTTWLWIAAGAIVTGGITVLILSLQKEDSSKEVSGSFTIDFPTSTY